MSSWRNYSRKKLLKKGVRKENVRIAGSGRLEELVRFIWHNGTGQLYSALGFSPTSYRKFWRNFRNFRKNV